MEAGDLARLRDIGIRSGEIVLVLSVKSRKSWVEVDYLHDGNVVEGSHSDFLEVIQPAK
jgi:hypothetical protein